MIFVQLNKVWLFGNTRGWFPFRLGALCCAKVEC